MGYIAWLYKSVEPDPKCLVLLDDEPFVLRQEVLELIVLFTELRVLYNGEFVDILSLLASSPSGVNNIVSGGGLAVSISNGVATITNTAQGSIGGSGSQ